MVRHAFSFILILISVRVCAQESAEADKRIVQTVQRLSSFDYSKASQRTKDAIDRYLTANAGSDEYFQLVEKFTVASQRDNLFELAAKIAGTPQAGQAVKLLSQLGQGSAVKDKLAALEPPAAASLIESVAAVGSKETTELAAGILTSAATPDVVCAAAVRGLSLNAAGQEAILAAARTGKLPESVKTAAAGALATSTDEAVRAAAAVVFNMPGAVNLPPVAELVKKPGDAAKGHTVFLTYCFSCHKVGDLGVDFGPALSEIGSKLAREALYDSILNPSAGISFGFEGWELKMKDGNNYVGMIASETDTEIALKVPGGIIVKSARNAIASRDKMKVSLMPPNLHTVMTEADLVNLVEYLVSLKK
jgi:putative heme-binding domain-containing protein